MKTIAGITLLALVTGSCSLCQAQSTTGGKSGGSTASTGTGYLTDGRRNVTSSPNSMTIADEGASRSYMYVPPSQTKNRSASPDGSSNKASSKSARKSRKSTAGVQPKKP